MLCEAVVSPRGRLCHPLNPLRYQTVCVVDCSSHSFTGNWKGSV